MINRIAFFNGLKTFNLYQKLKQGHVDSFNAILDHWEASGYSDLRWLAYMLATAYHETARTMLPVEEYGKGKGRVYGQKIKRNMKPYIVPDKIMYGRGLVQLTWYENYLRMGQLLGIDLLNHPEKALELQVAIKIMFEGMLKADSNFGDFTGKCLEMYFNDATDDPKGARRIINGQDKAGLIASYHNNFFKCLM